MKFNTYNWVEDMPLQNVSSNVELGKKLNKKISDLINNLTDQIASLSFDSILSNPFKPTLFNLYQSVSAFHVEEDSDVYRVKSSYNSDFSFAEDTCIFKNISDYIDSLYVPPKYFKVSVSVDVPVEVLSKYQMDSFPSDLADLCDYLGLDKNEVTYLSVDFPDTENFSLFSEYRTITLEKKYIF